MKLTVPRVIVFVAITVTMGVAPVFAQSVGTMTESHVEHIRANCHVALAALSQLHANDAPKYINRNQTYFSISDKLMARLNSRLTLNRYDATELVKISSNYNDNVAEFRTAYKAYDDLMTTAIHMDCIKEPVSFYDKVADARAARQRVHDLTVQLTNDIEKYKAQVSVFEAKNFPAEESK